MKHPLKISRLVLLRHFKSQWNLENRFTGWVDVPLAKEIKEGINEQLIEEIFNLKIERIYSSPLFRNIATVEKLFEKKIQYPVFVHLDGGNMQRWSKFKKQENGKEVLVFVSEKLNERHYGALQGENKEEVIKKYGQEKVRLWRRSYDVAPPRGESLKQVFKRVVGFYKKYTEKDLKDGNNVLVVASHNSLRALVKYVEGISDSDIIDLEIPYGGVKVYIYNNGRYIREE